MYTLPGRALQLEHSPLVLTLGVAGGGASGASGDRKLALALHESVGGSAFGVDESALDQDKLGLSRTERHFQGAGYNHPAKGRRECRRDGHRVARGDSAAGRPG